MELQLHETFDSNASRKETDGQSTSRKSPSHMAAPLDLSFKSYVSSADIAEDLESHQQNNLTRSSDTKKFSSSAVRINNNALSDLDGFADALLVGVESLDDIAWLDLSFNELSQVEEEILKFKNTKVLHLHGNCISRLEELDKLAALSQLRSLTTHGNPIENEKDYRLKSFDFSVITKQDRSKAEVWLRMKPKKLKRRKTEK